MADCSKAFDKLNYDIFFDQTALPKFLKNTLAIYTTDTSSDNSMTKVLIFFLLFMEFQKVRLRTYFIQNLCCRHMSLNICGNSLQYAADKTSTI